MNQITFRKSVSSSIVMTGINPGIDVSAHNFLVRSG
jgi:hypothetical protein